MIPGIAMGQDDVRALGIDIGNLTTKAVLFNDGQLLASRALSSADTALLSARAAAEDVLAQAGLKFDHNTYIVTTGAGGKSVPFGQQQKAITTCLARGVHYVCPSARMAIDIGAETITVIKLNDRGRVTDWANQDKCAAGTGVFLQQMAKLMEMSIEEMASVSFKAKSWADISSTCAVFAESEVISHVHRYPPTPKEDIVAGIYHSMVRRIAMMCKRIGMETDIAVVGGVALNSGLIGILQEQINLKVVVPDKPQRVAALGAAILARESLEKSAP
ncbi:MAG: acyl-CoA dehydratase activase [Chloroflexi bacterium]|nr:acyl-CoA dehydratase activase [Chloroflexota bacterium]